MPSRLNIPSFGNLEGIRVVVSAIEIAGPFSAQMMAEWGAEVIWIEHSSYDDTIRVQRNYQELDRRNQHSLSMNIFSEDGKEAFLKLIETADIFIESSKGPAFARRGITDNLLWQHKPDLVIAHLSGYGQYGVDEYVNLPSYDLIAQAFSGYLIQNGDLNQPIPAFPYAGDYFNGLMVLGSSLAALLNARNTGKGESIDVAMYESVLRVGQYYMMDYFNEGKLYPRSSKGKDPSQVGCGIYKCMDGFICIELVGSKQVKAMLNALGMSQVLGKDYPDSAMGLVTGTVVSDELEDRLDAYFATMTLTEAEKAMAEMVIACCKVMTIPELESNPQYVAREDIIEWKNQQGKKIKGPGIFPKFKNKPGKVWRPMPSRGKDSARILKDVGYTDEQIKTLADKGVLKFE